MDITKFAEERIQRYAKKIVEGGVTGYEHALGELTFYTALLRIVSLKGTKQDVGLMDAVNDTLQVLGIMASDKTFYNK